VTTTSQLTIPAPVPPAILRVQSAALFTFAVGTADRGFLAAADSLRACSDESEPLVVEQDAAWTRVGIMSAYFAGARAQAQRPTEASGRGFRANVAREGLRGAR
jgi:hypothetical protein